MYDIIIVGAGPAGLTAAIYALRADKKIKIFESNSVGGHITSSPLVSNYPGFIDVSGMEIADSLYKQVENLSGEVDYESVLQIIPGTPCKVITDCGEYESKTVILATGTKYRQLGLDKEEEFIGNGISFCVTCDGAFYKDKDVAVIGGGNSAVIEALELSKLCNKVYVVTIDNRLFGEEKSINKLLKCNNVEVIYNTEVSKYLGDNELTGIELKNGQSLNVDGLFLAIGQIPNIDILDNINKDKAGYVLSDDSCKTNFENIFVAGDVKSKRVRQLTTAVNDGTIAALEAIDYISKMEESK